MPRSFDSVFYGAAGGGEDLPSDDQFNRVSFLSHFDGANNGVNNAFDDSSDSNHTITANGNATQGSFGPFARPDGEFAVHFDGGGSYYCAADADFAFGTGDFCMEAWAFVEADDYSYSRIFCFGPAYGNNDSHGLLVNGTDNNDKIVYYDYRNSQFRLVSTTVTPINEWFHIAVTKASNVMRLFYNGQIEATATNTGAPEASSTNTVAIGNDPIDLSGQEAFQGFISNARVVKGSAVYTSNFTPSTGKLTAITNTKLLTCQSNRFVDNSAEAHAIIIGGTAVTIQVSAFGPFLPSAVYKPAVNGASAYFDGSGDRLHTPEDASTRVAASNFTFEAWVYPTTTTTAQDMIFTQGAPGVYSPFNVYILGTTVRIYISTNGTSWNIASNSTSSNSVQINAWTHVSLVRNGSTIQLYINGVADNTYAVSTTAFFTPTRETSVGGRDGEEYFTGYITDARLVIGTAVYTSAFTPPTAPLTAITNTKLLLNMADGQAIDSAAQAEWTATNVYDGTPKLQTAQKKIGTSSLYFDGSSSYYFPSGFLPDGTGDYTIEFWFRTSNLNDNATIFVAGNIYFQLYQNNLYYWNGASSRIISGTISTDTWYHVAGVRSGTTIYLFLNGTSQGTTLTGITGAVVGGAGYMGGNTGNYKYTGYIDEMRISRFARYTSSFTPATEPFADKGR